MYRYLHRFNVFSAEQVFIKLALSLSRNRVFVYVAIKQHTEKYEVKFARGTSLNQTSKCITHMN